MRGPVAEVALDGVAAADRPAVEVADHQARAVADDHVTRPAGGDPAQLGLRIHAVGAGLRGSQTEQEPVALLAEGEVAVIGVGGEGNDPGRAALGHACRG